MKYITAIVAVFSLLFSAMAQAALLNIKPESVEAEAWSILDTQTGQVIAEHNSHVQRAPASLTKMMVAYVALKEIQAGKLSKSEILTATPIVQTVMWDESQMYLKAGEQISVDQLLAGLIVMSANDAAVTLAEKISGGIPQFVERMNKEAKALGMHNTHFQNPAGITMPEHYSTSADLALLGQALVKEVPDYLYYSKQQSFSYNQRFHRATNRLLYVDPTVDGLKTGFTKAAGYNLAATANRPTGSTDAPNRRLVVVVLGTKSATKRAEVAHKLMNLAYTYTRNEVALKDKQLLAELPVVQSTLKMFKVETKQPELMTTSLADQSYAIDLNDFDQNTQRITLNIGNGVMQTIEPLNETQTRLNVEVKEKSLTAPLAQVMQLATVNIYQNNHLIRSIDIEDKVEIEESSAFTRFIHWITSLFGLFADSTPEVKIYPIQH
ncbi:D-alanyl-D-alanine carboxypeptidase [Acinetobacter sp. NCu2D-2]|uniref:D-alanyl-D-alanine carboxypeptidase PBP6B n=1 Tax=Acinetobacter sp. NCu2D-2 TaxID=1608473 RepID=UPI0007CDCD1C|nr:D-alanyl-D-alanine carboxypeptidase PBP6B [Acinetobacter sp. NCu2D-2]ANF82052.1 D-alanyl-D-alanine carboxypeptidase [Acinetobacter sp. NCu2D-2]